MNIGFIGLGIMGSRMTANLQKNGFALIVHDHGKEKALKLLAGQAEWAEIPALVGEKSDILFTVLPYPEAIRDVAEGPEGFLEHLKPGALWVDCSTNNPSFTKEMAGKTVSKGARYLDAAIAGSKPQAEKGELRFLVGGDVADIETCRPCFEAMGNDIVHAGPNGAGSTLKMVFNLMIGEAVMAFSEALTLGESLGLPRDKLMDAILNSHVAAPVLKGKRAKIEGGIFEADFPLKLMVKDLHQAVLTGYEQGVPLPGAGATAQLYALAAKYGMADKDYSALYSFLKTEAAQGKKPGQLRGKDQVVSGWTDDNV